LAQLYVIDTVCLIYAFSEVFAQGNRLSGPVSSIIERALASSTDVRLSIPSVVFLELFEKWCINDEMSRRIYYEVFVPIRTSESIEIRPIDREVIETLPVIRGNLARHEIHDKIILASAITLKCPLISVDGAIREFVQATRIIPGIIS
jgi:hypothetical protein